jgi:hypothetical protein
MFNLRIKFWIYIGTLMILWVGFLVLNKQRFSEQKLMQMMETPSIKKGLTADFCQYATGLDPKVPDMRYVKVNFKCKDKEALNTISWVTINGRTVEGIINLIKNINGINSANDMLDCNIDGAVANMETKINVGNLITCRVN